jgi:molybdate transport system substrate-binding protein
MKLLCTLALSGVVEALKPGFEAAQGVHLRAEFLPTAVLMPRLASGEAADVTILTADGIEALVQSGLVQPASVTHLARSFVGVAVKAGADHPDISTPEAFVATLQAAKSVAMSRQGASGLFLAGLLRRLGLDEEIGAKATIIETGYTAELAASGAVELALQQVSELMVIPGIEIVGRLPAELGGETIFTGAVLTGSGRPHLGGALLKAIAGSDGLLVGKGLEGV